MKKLLYIILGIIIGGSALTVSAQALRVITAPQGGTGIGSVTGGDVGLCLKVSDDSPFTWAVGSCGGGGSSGGTWSTTTSQVAGQFINYPNETDDVVVIGSNASTSAEYVFDPNNPVYSVHYKLLSNLFGNNSSTTILNLSSREATSTNATSSNLYVSGRLFNAPLTSALVQTGSDGLFAEYAGSSCTNQFARSLSALGVITCESVGNEDFEDDDWGDISVATNVVSVEDDSHAHTGATISGLDISADTNLTAGDNLTLTDDDLDLDTTLTSMVAATFSGLVTSGNFLATSSSTLQNFTFVNATGTSATTTSFFATTASTTNFAIGGGSLSIFGTVGTALSDFCTAITGGAGLCDGSDATGAGGDPNSKWATTTAGDSIRPNGAIKVGIGTTTPFSILSVSTSTGNVLDVPLFTVASSSHETHFTVFGKSGNVGIGISRPSVKLHVSIDGSVPESTLLLGTETFLGSSNTTNNFRLISSNATANLAPAFVFVRTRGTPSVPTIPLINDDLGLISAQGYDGTTRRAAGTILFSVDDNVGSGGVAGRLSFLTTATSSATAAEHMRINSKGNIGIGTTTQQWKLQIATSSAPQLTLSDFTTLTDPHWSFRNSNGTFYLATSSPTTYSTSTMHSIRIDSTNTVTFGNSLATCIALTGAAALCDGTDATGGGASFGKTWEVGPVNYIAPTSSVSVIVGASTTPSVSHALFQVNATGTTGDLIKASSTVSFVGNFLRFLNNAGTDLFRVESTGGFLTMASSTLQNFTGVNATTTSATSTSFFATTASTTNFAVGGGTLSLFGTVGTALSDFCTAITGGAGLCDGNDATGGGASFGKTWEIGPANYLAPTTTVSVIVGASTTPSVGHALFQVNATGTTGDLIKASSTVSFAGNFFRAISSAGTELFKIASDGATTIAGALTLSNNLIFDSETLDSLTDDATLDNNSGDLRVVDVTCTDCLGPTEIDETAAYTWTGAHIFNNITRSTTTQATTTNFHVSAKALTIGGTGQYMSATSSFGFAVASTTMDAMGKSFSTGTTTRQIATFPEARTLTSWYCVASSTGTVRLRFGDGTNWTADASCSTTGARTYPTSNNTFTSEETIWVQIGTSATNPSDVSISATTLRTSP